MPTFRGNAFANYFNRILQINQSSNSNVDSTTRTVQSGGGVDTAISLSDDQLLVKPNTDDTTSALDVKTSGGTSILTADTTNKRVLCGSSQINALTQYQTFNNSSVSAIQDDHMVLMPSAGGQVNATMQEWNLGDGADPATTLDVSAEGTDTHNLVICYWYLPDAITIMSAHVLMGAAGSADNDLNFHLMSYDVDTTTNYGDLSNGVVVADSGTTEDVDEDVIKYTTMTNLPTDVAAGKVILATVESSASNTISVNMVVKYHIQ
jgi:hypothetical protein